MSLSNNDPFDDFLNSDESPIPDDDGKIIPLYPQSTEQDEEHFFVSMFRVNYKTCEFCGEPLEPSDTIWGYTGPCHKDCAEFWLSTHDVHLEHTEYEIVTCLFEVNKIAIHCRDRSKLEYLSVLLDNAYIKEAVNVLWGDIPQCHYEAYRILFALKVREILDGLYRSP